MCLLKLYRNAIVKALMKHHSGFTVIELLIVIVVIAILATISTLAFSSIQRDQRDSSRDAQVQAIADSLESYYEKHGEYPSPALITAPDNTAIAVSQVLGIKTDLLLLPRASEDSGNSLISSDEPSPTEVAYVAKSALNDTSCQSSTTGGCDQFVLRYQNEINESIKEIKSRKSGRYVDPNIPPETPTLTANQSSTSLLAISSYPECQQDGDARFSFRQKSSAQPTWSAWSGWGSSNRLSRTGNVDSVVYTFQVMTRCEDGVIVTASSQPSNEASVTYGAPLVSPSVPVVVIGLSGANVQASVSATCSIGTLEYQLRSRTNGSAWTNPAWTTNASWVVATAAQGVKYEASAFARCVRPGSTGPQSALGSSSAYIHPISTPGKPTVTASTSGDTTTWSWPAISCPAGTTTRYQIQSIADWNYDSGWTGPYAGMVSQGWGTASQGYEYKKNVRAHCYNVNTTSAWGAAGTAAYIRPVTAPGGATNFVHKLINNRTGSEATWTPPTCGPGASPNHRSITYVGNGMVWPATGKEGWNLPWPAPGFYTHQAGVNYRLMDGGVAKPGSKLQFQVQYICKNMTTSRQSAYGPIVTSPMFTL